MNDRNNKTGPGWGLLINQNCSPLIVFPGPASIASIPASGFPHSQ
jgi:hypothetical protein